MNIISTKHEAIVITAAFFPVKSMTSTVCIIIINDIELDTAWTDRRRTITETDRNNARMTFALIVTGTETEINSHSYSILLSTS